MIGTIKKLIKPLIPQKWLEWYLYDYKKYVSPEKNPEKMILAPFCIGKGADIGCGGNKTVQHAIGVDIRPRGTKGLYGSQQGMISQADVVGDATNLHMFNDGELDFLVGRHILEHCLDVVLTLQEWKRVLKIGGLLCIVLPDERCGETIKLDPTHVHVFTPNSFKRLLEVVGGFKIIRDDIAIQSWSFYVVAKKVKED